MDGRRHLDPGTLLDAYRIVRVVGAGAFGVTYEATDVNLGTTIAIKEYFPDDFATRTHDSQVRPSSDRHSETFNWGRNGFLEEARTLARFRHPSIVQIYRIFEANSTAYMVMAFENGPSFERWLRGLERRPTQDELDLFLRSLLDALQVMHENNFLHRDIAPDNIIIRHDSTPVLLDFGAARKNIAAKTHMVTGIYKQGYSPQEQYSTDGKFQGPWSDFYALGATLYRAVTGMPPDESPSRGIQDTLVPAVEAGEGSYRRAFLTAIDACLKLKPLDRPQTAHEVRELAFTGTTNHQPDVPAPAAEARSSPKTGNVARPRRPWRLSSTPALALSAVAIAATYMIYQLTAAHLKDFKAQPTVQQKPQSAAIAPKPTLPTGNTLLLQLATGNVAIRLRPDIAPKHVERIKLLASEGFYNGMKFHRVIPNFVAQTGDPTDTGNGGSKYPNVNAEFSVQFFQRGTVGASRTKDPNSFNSQFFICTGDCAPLSFNYTILGEVVQGMEHVERLAKGEPPAKPDIIVTARIVESSGR